MGEWDTVNMAKATQLAHISGRLMKVSILFGLQSGSFGSNKWKMSTYLAKNNNAESMEKVSDEVKRKECAFYNILCLYMELKDKFLK
jgi:hypothetical protein